MDATKAALVVAAYEFEDPRFQRLRSPARDVDGLARVLGDPAIGGFGVQTVVNQPVSLVQQELERFFAERTPEDLLLLYFSCHGVKDSTGRLYFATTNTALDLLRSTGVSASFVSEQLELTRSKRIVVLLDCCYSGAFLKGFQARGDDAVSVSQLEGRGRAVITASRATEYAFEADQLAVENAQPSIFTGAIIDGLATGKADRDGDGRVTVDELYDFVYDRVRGNVAGQTPGRWVNLEGELVIARNPYPPVKPAELTGELARAIDSDVALHRLGAVVPLTAWLEGGDAGERATARIVLARLSNDYDQRVRQSASAALARHPDVAEDGRPPPPSPDVPAPSAQPGDGSGAAAAAAVAATRPGDAPGRAAEEAETGAPTDRPPGLDAAGSPAAATAIGPRRTRDGPRIIGWLVVFGLVALVLGVFLPYVHWSDSEAALADDNWSEFWLLVVAALTGYAALSLLDEGRSPDTGIEIVLGLGPTVPPVVLLAAGVAVEQDGERFGLGLVALALGGLAMLAATVVAGLQLRRRVALTVPRSRAAVVLSAVAGLIGVAAAVAWGDLIVRHDDQAGLGLSSGQVWDFVIRLVVLTALVCLLAARWPPRLRGAVRIALTTLLYLAVVVLFLLVDDEPTAGRQLFLAAFALFAVGAVAVPFLSTLLEPRRSGALVLASWSVAQVAVWANAAVEGPHAGAGLVLVVTLLAGLGIALLLNSDRPAPGVAVPE